MRIFVGDKGVATRRCLTQIARKKEGGDKGERRWVKGKEKDYAFWGKKKNTIPENVGPVSG